MAEYNNQDGWEAQKKTLDYWKFIPMKYTKYTGFDMPPLFKGVNPIIKWLIVGFFGIFILEGFATFGVAMTEGVPIEIIALLIIVDILFAILPHLLDGTRTDLKNFIFIGKYHDEVLNLDNDEKKKYKAGYISKQDKLKNLNTIRIFLYLPIILSALVKLWLFFSQYPFFDTYQAYIVIICYTVGCFLHILCTGHVIMYWRFRGKLNKDRKHFSSSNSEVNRAIIRPDKLINIKGNLVFQIPDHNQHRQKVVTLNNLYYLHYEGILFDEEINDLIGHQEGLKQELAIAVTGKIIQTNLLSGTD